MNEPAGITVTHIILSALTTISVFVVVPLVAYIMRIRQAHFDSIEERLDTHLRWHAERGPHGERDHVDAG